jgi:hypothetical protein
VSRSSSEGWTLVEALVALALLGLGLMLDLGLQARSRELDTRLAAEADLVRRAEAVVESLRAGVHPLRSGAVDPTLAWPSAPDGDLAMILLVDTTEVPSLCRVTVRGQVRARRGPPHDVELVTSIWQPGSPCL